MAMKVTNLPKSILTRPPFACWNYRVMEQPDGQCYIGEAYYDHDGNVTGWTNACAPHGDTLDEVKDDLLHMMKALDLPTLKTEAL